MKKLPKIDKYLKAEPKDDAGWVRVVHAVRAAMREEELTGGDKSSTDTVAKKIMKERHLKVNTIYV